MKKGEKATSETKGINVMIIVIVVAIILIVIAIVVAMVFFGTSEEEKEKDEEEKEAPGYYLFAILYHTTIFISISDTYLIYSESAPPHKFSGENGSQISYNGEKLFYNVSLGDIRTVAPDSSWLPLYIKKKSGFPPPFDHALTSENGKCDAIITSDTRNSRLVMCSESALSKGSDVFVNCTGTQTFKVPARYFLYYAKTENLF